MRSPVLCGGGHTWCLDCVNKSDKNKCPLCPKSINREKPTPNFTVKSMIDKMTCRCPHNSGETNPSNSKESKPGNIGPDECCH